MTEISHEDDEVATLRRENAVLQSRVTALEKTAAKLDLLYSIMPEIVIVLDADGAYLEIAPTSSFPAELAAGLIGGNVKDNFPLPLAEQLIAAIRQTLATRAPVSLGYPVLHGGEELWHTAVLHPISESTVLWFAKDMTAEQRLGRAERGLRTFEAIVESAPDGISLISPDGTFSYANQSYRALTGLGEEMVKTTIFAVHADPHATVAGALQEALAHGAWQGRMSITPRGGPELPCQVSIFRLPGEGEEGRSLAVTARDMTPFLEAERQRVELQQQVIEAQRAALRELSIPLVPLADGVIAMPLIGTLDAMRTQEVMERLLSGIVQQRVHTAILDLTGVRAVDAPVADGLLGIARAAKLLGARVILTGIGPEIAQTLVHLQSDLGGILIKGNLQAGIAHALRATGTDRGGAR